MAKGKQKQTPKTQVDAMEQINLNAAGIDIGAEEVYVAVPPDRDEQSVRSYPTFTADLYRLADWLRQCGIETVAMEATGVYWIPLYEILEERGFRVYLVNARHLEKRVGAQDGCAGLSMDPAVAHLWLVERLLPSSRRDRCHSQPGAPSRDAGAVPLVPYPAHAKGLDG
jgi:hypothetical protein